MMKMEKLRELLKEHEIDALLVTNTFNRRYMTGFTGSAGLALISHDDAVFITDFRYTEQAEKQIDGFRIVMHSKTIIEEVAEQANLMKLGTIGFEKDDLTFGLYELYKKAVQAELKPVSNLVEKIRMVKTADELVILKKAAKIADDAFAHICTFIKPGVTEIEVSNELEFFMRKQGATSSSFDIIVASGLRGALPHGVATDKVIESGDLVTLDYGALYDGYISDITRTVAVGEPSEKLKEIYAVTLAAQELAVKNIKPGMTGIEADAIARDYIKSKGYGEAFGHSTGHGIGLEVHESPGLSSRSETVLEPNMAVTVEPGIYLPGIGGVRIEDDIIMTAEGNERLTVAPKELIIL
ncbi:Xaa-Pro peptidase family protein [Filibacter tadaridae]|uniref:M24 family metallopeptidase n=1 Tax=Filibacter tadaridae TaxID=2483811 RepID=UPI0031F366CD